MNLHEEDDYEAFEGPGFIVERRGRFLRTRPTLSAEAHAEMRRAMGETVPEIREGMGRDVGDLFGVLHQYKPEAMIGAAWLRNCAFAVPTEGAPSSVAERTPAFAEYVATLYIRDPGQGDDDVVLPEVLEDVQSRVESLFTAAMWLLMAQEARREDWGQDKNLRELRFLTLVESLFVRYPGYHQHLADVLSGIHSAMRHDLRDALGWNVDDALRIAEAVASLVEDRLNEAYDCAREAVLENKVEALEGDERRRWEYGLVAWIYFRMQDILTFTVEEIAGSSGVPGERVEAFLQAACLPWASCGEDFYRYPHPTPPLQRKPVLRLGEDQYLVPVPTSLLWGVRHVTEDALKADRSESGREWWQRYEEARSRFAECQAIGLLAKALPHAGAFHSLKYPWVVDGEHAMAELDGLVIADDVALLIEVKAGSMSPAARRGAPDGMKEDLQALVGDPHLQALRARDYLKSADEVEFWLDDDTGLTVKSGQLDEFIMVTVSLDSLDLFTATLYRLTDLGVVGDADLPWAVSLLDLAVISEAVEFPAQLIHFLRRRARINELAFVMAHDELDWFGHYLSEGLYFEHLIALPGSSEPQPVLNYFGYSEGLDAHFAWDERGGRERPPLPRQDMPDDMRALVLELEAAQHHGYLRIASALLDLSTEARDQFFTGIAEAMRRTQADGDHHEFVLVPDRESGRGLTFVCSTDREELQHILRGYCRLKMYQARCPEWLGIGRLVPSDNLLDEAAFLQQPWEYDEGLEQLAADWLRPLPKRADLSETEDDHA